jgi:peptide/nickel transport system substrate-binding protein
LRGRHLVGVGALAGILAMGLGLAPAVSGAASSRAVTPHASGTLTFPEVQNDYQFIWPYINGAQFSTGNTNFQQLQYRPLYWFGVGNSYAYSAAESLANTPHIVGTTVTITMKGRKWSNGKVVDAKSVLFWINMAKTHPTDYGGYASGVGVPDEIKSAHASGNTLTLHIDHTVNPTWFLYNALATITPMPASWDAGGKCGLNGTYAAAAPYHLTTAAIIAGCNTDFNHLSGLSSNPTVSNYSNAVWKISDGPYNLGAVTDDTANAGGVMPSYNVNPTYAGPQKSAYAHLKFVYYASTTAEYTQLQTNGLLAQGGVSNAHVSPAPNTSTPGVNLDSSVNNNYAVRIGSLWGFQYAYINFDSHSSHHNLLAEQYIRQALELSMDQTGLGTTVYRGYDAPTCNPLPTLHDPYQTSTSCPFLAKTSAQFTANVTAAKNLLSSHGWNAAGVCTAGGGCQTAGEPAIPNGTHLNLTLTYTYSAGGTRATIVGDEVSEWNTIGIHVTEDRQPNANATLGVCVSNSYDICWYGGWVYSPGAFPSGEQLLLTGAASNIGSYSNANMDHLIHLTIAPNTAAATATAMKNYAGFAASQVPFLYEPLNLGAIEVNRSLTGKGLGASPLATFNPEYIKHV